MDTDVTTRQHETSPQESLIELVARIAKADPRFLAVAIGGSFARGEADALSDVDIYLILDEQLSAQFDALTSWLAPLIGEVLLSWDRGRKEGFGHLFQVLYADLTKCDYNLLTPSMLESHYLWQHRRIVLDKTGLLQRFLEEQQQSRPRIDIEKESQEISTSFWLECIKAHTSLQRGQLWNAIFYLNNMREDLCLLIRLRAGSSSLNPLRAYKRFEIEVGSEAGRELGNTLCSYSEESIRRALFECIRLFRQTVNMIIQEHDVAYCCDAEHRILLAMGYPEGFHLSYESCSE